MGPDEPCRQGQRRCRDESDSETCTARNKPGGHRARYLTDSYDHYHYTQTSTGERAEDLCASYRKQRPEEHHARAEQHRREQYGWQAHWGEPERPDSYVGATYTAEITCELNCPGGPGFYEETPHCSDTSPSMARLVGFRFPDHG